MVLKQKETTVGYFCPACGAGVKSMVGAFALHGDLLRLKCPCGKSAMSITCSADKKVRLEVPCFVCPKPHRYQVEQSTFFGNELLCLPCSLSGFDACFVGNEDAVSAAMHETEGQLLTSLEEAGLDIDREQGLSGIAQRELHMEKNAFDGDGGFDGSVNFDDNHIMDMVSFVIRDMIDGNDIACRCEKAETSDPEKYQIRYDENGITVTCRDCGASRTVSCNSSIEANAFLECEKLVLQ